MKKTQLKALATKIHGFAVKRKKVTRRKPVVAKKKPERRRSPVKPTVERVGEQTGTV